MPTEKIDLLFNIAHEVEQKYKKNEAIQFALTYFKSAYYQTYGYNDSAQIYNERLINNYDHLLVQHEIKPLIFENWINTLYQQNKDKEIGAALSKYKIANKETNDIFIAVYNNRIGNQKRILPMQKNYLGILCQI